MKKKHDLNFLLALSDFWEILRKNRAKIILGSLLLALLAMLYSAAKPVLYPAVSTFREKGVTNSGLSRSTSLLASFLGTGADLNDSEAVSVMKSRRLMEKLVESENLQAQINRHAPGQTYLQSQVKEYWDRISKNFMVQYAYFMDEYQPILDDDLMEIRAENILYFHEVPLYLIVKFIDDSHFEVKDAKNETPLVYGTIGEPFFGREYHLTLQANEPDLKDKQFMVILWPVEVVADRLSKAIDIESDRVDKTLIKLKYTHSDRFVAPRIVNSIMNKYQDYLKREHQRVSTEQLAYLQTRQKESHETLREVMENYAHSLSNELASIGFASSQKAMEFLTTNQHTYKQKLMVIEQEIKRIDKDRFDGTPIYDRYVSDLSSVTVNNLVAKIREMKLQSDSVDLALRHHPLKDQALDKDVFTDQMRYLEEIQADRKEAEQVLAMLEKNTLVPVTTKLIHNQNYMAGHWNERLNKSFQEWKEAANPQIKEQKRGECLNCKDNFGTYLKNLVHLLNVHEKTLQEKLTHLHLIEDEFQGVDLNLAKDLFLHYSKELSNVEAQIAQQDYILTHMQDTEFEISSLSSILADSVSREMIQKASNIVLQLRDENNRSTREQERLKEELIIQRGFIVMHLKQTNELLHLKEMLLKNKAFHLQKSTLGLIQQQISILEKQLADHVDIHLNNLKQERKLITLLQEEIKQEMAKLPTKWVEEQLVDQQVELTQRMGREITNLVESKNINSNLEMIQSAPVDLALPALQPRNPRLPFFAVFGAILGFCLSLSFVTVSEMIRGIKASEDNIKLVGRHVSGRIKASSGDLEPLRRLTAYVTAEELKKQSLLLLQGKGYDYSKDLAALMSKTGLRVFLLPLLSNNSAAESFAGLLQYLEGSIPTLPITEVNGYWTTSRGGHTLYSSELMNSKRFNHLLQELLSQYDWVIGVSVVNPLSGEAEILMKQFEASVINVTDEKLKQLEPLFYLEKSTSFIFTDNREKNIEA